jgi:hypothetical protein
MGLFPAVIIIIIIFKIFIFCLNILCDDCIAISGAIRSLFQNKALRRFLLLDCKCSCYRSRPKRRFQMRLGLLFICFILRITAIGLYASAPSGDNDGRTLAVVCAFSLILLFNTLWLDLYRYTV